MGDEQDATGQGPPEPPFEETSFYVIPEDVINAWVAIPYDAEVQIHLNRTDVDRFFFSMMKLHEVLIKAVHFGLLNKDVDPELLGLHRLEAAQELQRSRHNFRRFMDAVMRGAAHGG